MSTAEFIVAECNGHLLTSCALACESGPEAVDATSPVLTFLALGDAFKVDLVVKSGIAHRDVDLAVHT